jgi:hypothetical protein
MSGRRESLNCSAAPTPPHQSAGRMIDARQRNMNGRRAGLGIRADRQVSAARGQEQSGSGLVLSLAGMGVISNALDFD